MYLNLSTPLLLLLLCQELIHRSTILLFLFFICEMLLSYTTLYYIASFALLINAPLFFHRIGNTDSQGTNNGSENGIDENTENKNTSTVRLGKGHYPRNSINANNTGSANLNNSDAGKTVKKVQKIIVANKYFF